MFFSGRVGGSVLFFSLDLSFEKIILGFFLEVRCWVFGRRRVGWRGLGVIKLLFEVAGVRCWCLEIREGRGMSLKREERGVFI